MLPQLQLRLRLWLHLPLIQAPQLLLQMLLHSEHALPASLPRLCPRLLPVQLLEPLQERLCQKRQEGLELCQYMKDKSPGSSRSFLELLTSFHISVHLSLYTCL